jgi:hypothetical protein
MTTRFELEQALQELWQISEDLQLVVENIINGDMADEEVANTLIGLRNIHLLRCQKTDDIFEELIRNGSLQ